jgi:hypothetical protein
MGLVRPSHERWLTGSAGTAPQMTSTMNDLFRRPALALVLCLPLAAPAQIDAKPAAGGASAPRLQYRSAFADYTPWQDIKPGDWRALNESVKGAGMAAHTMGSMAPAAAPAAGSAALAPASPGHPMHGGRP